VLVDIIALRTAMHADPKLITEVKLQNRLKGVHGPPTGATI